MATATSPAATPAPTTIAPSRSQANALLSSDFQTFLEMLTAQARFQDPLEPMDSSQYAAQLAQFSMVEQQVKANELLESLAARMGGGELTQLAGWIGMEARTPAPVPFDGSPITLHPNPVASADEAILVVYDNTGNEVQRTPIPVSADPVEWAGVTDDGTPFEEGLYSFAVESRAGGELLISDPAESYARVTEVRSVGSDTILILDGGSPIPAGAVTALREAA